VTYIDQTTKSTQPELDIVAEFGQLTDIETLSKRQAVALLARRHGLQPNAVYRAVEQARKSGD
jgi:transposase-like protein